MIESTGRLAGGGGNARGAMRFADCGYRGGA